MTPRRALLAIVAASWLVLSAFVWNHGSYPNGAWAPGSSDHYSHWSTAILFYHRGVEVYRRPLYLVCPEAPAEGVYQLVARGDVCNIPERAGRRPLTTNWRQFPRPYPPGWLLWHAPVALLHEHTALSFHALNRLMVIQDLLGAHLAILALASLLLLRRAGEPRAAPTALAVRAFAVVLGALELIRWSMLGYYDPIAVACAFVGIARMGSRRDADAALWFSLAIFLHYRAAWIGAPLLVICGLRAVRERESRPGLALAGALLATTLVAFVLVRPALRTFPHTNPIFWFWFDRMNAEHWNLVVPMVLAFGLLIGTRAYLVAAVFAFQFYVVTRTLQVQPWHALSLLPLIGLARIRPGRGAAEVAAIVLFLVECRQIFEVTPLPGAWLGAIFRVRG